jgi:hypothetical protein
LPSSFASRLACLRLLGTALQPGARADADRVGFPVHSLMVVARTINPAPMTPRLPSNRHGPMPSADIRCRPFRGYATRLPT